MMTTGTHLLQLPRPLVASLISAVMAGRSPQEGAELLRLAGYDAGESIYEMLRDRLAARGYAGDVEESDASAFWEALSDSWGTVRHRELHPGVAEISSGDWFEADAVPAGGACHLSTGIFADLLRRVAGDDVAVLEVGCRARGDDDCRFLFGGPAALEALHARIGAGEDLETAVRNLV